MRAPTRQTGFTVIEAAIAAAVVATVVLVAFSTLRQWSRDQHSTEMARAFAELLMQSRTEALARSQTTVVFFAEDRHGRPLETPDGEGVAALAIVDLDGDGEIDADEHLGHVPYAPAGTLSWGHSDATRRARGDLRGRPGAPPAGPITFQQPDGSLASWIAFGPDGNPVSYRDASPEGTGAPGSGGGAVYLTTGGSDFAVVLSGLGKVYVRQWDDGDESWSR